MYIKFIADDYGQDLTANKAIEDVCGRGLIKSVTVLVAENCIYNKQAFSNDIDFGVHLYLTEFRPLTTKLLERGVSLSKRELMQGLLNGRFSSRDFYKEFCVQIKRLSKNGFEVKFIDTHQNIHGLPLIFPSVYKVSKMYGLECRIRPFAQLDFNFKLTPRILFSRLYAMYVNYKPNSRVIINCPGYKQEKIDLPWTFDAWDKFLSRLVKEKYDEVIVPCHPGISPAEVQLYSSQEFVRLLVRHNVSFS